MDPAAELRSSNASADYAVLTSILMGVQGVGIALSSGCGGLLGGVMGAMGLFGLADGSMAGGEAGILLLFSVFKFIGVAAALATGALLVLASYQMSQGGTRLVNLAAMAGIAMPVLQLAISMLSCSVFEAMIWFLWLPIGALVFAMSLQTRPERFREQW